MIRVRNMLKLKHKDVKYAPIYITLKLYLKIFSYLFGLLDDVIQNVLIFLFQKY